MTEHIDDMKLAESYGMMTGLIIKSMQSPCETGSLLAFHYLVASRLLMRCVLEIRNSANVLDSASQDTIDKMQALSDSSMRAANTLIHDLESPDNLISFLSAFDRPLFEKLLNALMTHANVGTVTCGDFIEDINIVTMSNGQKPDPKNSESGT